MATKIRIGNESRKNLADSKLGMSYNERLEKAGVKFTKGKYKMVHNSNGYTEFIER